MAQAVPRIRGIPSVHRLVSSVHGNCVFPDAHHRVHIEHHPTGAITTRGLAEDAEGRVYFPLPTLPPLEAKPRPPPYVFRPDGTQEDIPDPDEGPSTSEIQATGVGNFVIPPLVISIALNQAPANAQQQERSYVSLVELYRGEQKLWSSRPLEEFTSFRLPIMTSPSIYSLAQSEQGLSVSVTIRFGCDGLQFSSVALIALLPNVSGTRIP